MINITTEKKGNKFVYIFIFFIIGFFVLASLGFLVLVFALAFSSADFDVGNVAVIDISGVIMTESSGSFYSSELSSSDVVKLIRQADEDSGVKAIIFMVNSPGGSPVATDEIAYAIKKTNKTTVAVIREYGASGAYWIASACDYIFANRMSLVGSIGVTSAGLGFEDFITEYNVTYRRLVAGEYKDIGTPFRAMTDEEKEFMQQELNILHDIFIDEITENRGLPREKVKELANGLFWTGIEAKELGLVDNLGGEDDALSYVAQVENITPDPVKYETEVTFADLLMGAFNDFSYQLGNGMSSGLLSQKQSALYSFS